MSVNDGKARKILRLLFLTGLIIGAISLFVATRMTVEKAQKMGESRDPRAVEPLINALDHSDRRIRKAAAEALGRTGDVRAVEPLIATLENSYDVGDVRQSAAEALGIIGDSKAVKPLIAAAKEDDLLVSNSAAAALVKIGKINLEPLIAALNDEDQGVREVVARALGESGDVRAIGPLLALIKDDKPGFHAVVADALGNIGEPAVEPLIAALQDDNGLVREAAAYALGKIGDVRAVAPLITAYKWIPDVQWDKNNETIRCALLEIGEAAIEPLIAALQSDDSIGRSCAAKTLWSFDKDKFSPVQQAVYYVYTNQSYVNFAIDPAAIEPLIVALRDQVSLVRRSAATVLGKTGDARAIEPLIAALKDEHPDVRDTAGKALAALGEAALIAALQQPDADIREFAAKALGEIGVEKLSPVHQAIYYVNTKQPEKAVVIGPAAIEPLIAGLADNDWAVRCRACEALAQFGQAAIDGLLAGDPAEQWHSFALALCREESAALVLNNLQQGNYPAETKCMLMGWLGSDSGGEKLRQVALGAEIHLAARNQNLDDRQWAEAIDKAVEDSSRIEFTLAALSLCPPSSERQSQVEALSLFYIRRGDLRIIPELVKLLNMYGNTSLAEDYLNCGQPDLESAARSWAMIHGYPIKRGAGSSRASWGSGQ